MALSSSYLKPSHPPHVFTLKSPPPSPSPTSTSMKLKTLIQTSILSHVCRFIRALSRARSILIRTFREKQHHLLFYPKKATKKQKKIFYGSFRLHYNWCSSHVMPVPAPALEDFSGRRLYYDSTWNSAFSTDPKDNDVVINGDQDQSELSGYLQWLEEKVGDDDIPKVDEEKMNEIDKLADMFIASCHEKFRLEKVESYRRFQEMLARSL